jgi:uncharacterized protein (DUF952 family)
MTAPEHDDRLGERPAGPVPIVHIATQSAWAAAQAEGVYRPPSLEDDGFIHCSRPDQIPRVLDAGFPDRRDLLLLCTDTERVGAPVRWEADETGEAFPHVYGPIEVGALTPQAISTNESPSRTRDPGTTGARSTRTSST